MMPPRFRNLATDADGAFAVTPLPTQLVDRQKVKRFYLRIFREVLTRFTLTPWASSANMECSEVIVSMVLLEEGLGTTSAEGPILS